MSSFLLKQNQSNKKVDAPIGEDNEHIPCDSSLNRGGAALVPNSYTAHTELGDRDHMNE